MVVVIAPVCAAASLCQFGKEYWSEEEGACVKCSRCEQPDARVVLRPCQVHRDTVCGPLSSLPIDWPWAKHRTPPPPQTVTTEHHHSRPRSHAHQHAHQQHDKHRNRNEFNDPDQHRPPLPPHHHKGDEWPLADVDEWEHWLQKRLQHKKEDLLKRLLLEQQHNTLAHTFDDDDRPSNEEDESTTHRHHISRLDVQIFEKLVNEERQRQRQEQEQEEDEMAVTRRRLDAAQPFSAAETLVWDWQAVALIAAVVACLLFFMFAAIYSLLHVRQWRRLKDDLHLDVEDLAVRVSLMNNGGLNSPATEGGNTNHYLEQLLAVKKEGENMSNVYVEKQPKAS